MRYSVRIQPSGKEFMVEAGETVLDAALRQDIALPHGCKDGACGSCKVRVLSGTVNYVADPPSGLSELHAGQGDALLCQALLSSDLVIEAFELDAVKGIAVQKLPCRVSYKQTLCHDVQLLKLKLPASKSLQYLAGQYVNIILRDGQRREFSIANAPHNNEFIEVHIRHVPGGQFTHYVFHEMQDKALLRIEGPMGSFFLREESRLPIILVGGGTGFAPLKAILEHAFHVGTQRPMHLFWGVRTQRDLYLHDLPLMWEREHKNFRYTPVLSDPVEASEWQGDTGLVTDSVVRYYPDLTDQSVYISGPTAMVREGKRCFHKNGLPENQLFFDAFAFATNNRTSAGG